MENVMAVTEGNGGEILVWRVPWIVDLLSIEGSY